MYDARPTLVHRTSSIADRRTPTTAVRPVAGHGIGPLEIRNGVAAGRRRLITDQGLLGGSELRDSGEAGLRRRSRGAAGANRDSHAYSTLQQATNQSARLQNGDQIEQLGCQYWGPGSADRTLDAIFASVIWNIRAIAIPLKPGTGPIIPGVSPDSFGKLLCPAGRLAMTHCGHWHLGDLALGR